MAHEQHHHCIAECYACADACDHCAVSCLNEPDPKPMARCIALDMDCAQTCRLAAALMARGSPNDSAARAFCALVCEACAEECARHSMMEHCQACALACRRCAQACRDMSHQPMPRSASSAGTHAHRH